MVVYPHWPRLSIDFDNSSAVFVLYPWGAGGKFVINSLAVSARAVLQHADLAQQQLDRKFSAADKKQEILRRLEAEQGHWQDLHFSVDALTGVNEQLYITESVDTAQYWPWTNFMHVLSRSGMNWFADVHDAGHLEAMCAVWPRARIIRFVNTEKFLTWRRVNYNRKPLELYWQSIRDQDWPIQAPETWAQFQSLDTSIQRELLFERRGDIFRYVLHPEAQTKYHESREQREQQVCAARETYAFDAQVLLDTDQYIQAIKDLYQWVDLYDFDKDFLVCYHKTWLEKIQQVPI